MTSYFSVIQSMYYICAVGIMQAFLVPMYSDCGYSTGQISILVAVANFAAFISQPLLGRLMDKKAYVGKILPVVLLIGIAAFCIVYFKSDVFVLVAAGVFILYATTGSLCYLLDAWAVRLGRQGIKVSYTTSKTIGSIVYSVFVIVFGKLLDVCGFRIMVPSFIISSVLCIIFILGVKDPGNMTLQENEENAVQSRETMKQSPLAMENSRDTIEQHGEKASTKTSGKHSQNIRKLIFVAIAILILFFSSNTVYSFLSLVIKEHGGTNSNYGIAQFLVAVMETAIIFLYDKVAKKVSNRDKLLFGFIMCLVSVIAISFAPSISIIIIGAGLHGIFSGFYIAGIANYVPEIVDDKHNYTYCMIVASCVSGATMLASLYIGTTSDAVGLQNSMKLSIITIIMSIIIFAFFTKEDKTKSPGTVIRDI